MTFSLNQESKLGTGLLNLALFQVISLQLHSWLVWNKSNHFPWSQNQTSKLSGKGT